MKSALALILTLSTLTAAKRNFVRGSGSWVQVPSGQASFTRYTDCQSASCGRTVSGYSAAVNELAFGANSGAGDVCGRCFKITPTYDPYTPSYQVPPGHTIVVKVNDLCPISDPSDTGPRWCSQTVSKPLNGYGMPMHFDLCDDSGSASAFFSDDRGAMLGTYDEVSCSEWRGSDGPSLWNGSCLTGESCASWPAVGCGNSGTPPP